MVGEEDKLNAQGNGLQSLMCKALSEGTTLKVLKEISDDQMEAIYSLAYQDYQAGKYERSAKLFRILALLDHFNVKYVLGHAAVQKKLSNHTQAVFLYSCAYLLDSNDVRIPYYAGICHMEMGNYVEAESAFYLASSMVAEKEEYQSYVERAASLLTIVQHRAANDGCGEKSQAVS